jgi:hypothetical protein
VVGHVAIGRAGHGFCLADAGHECVGLSVWLTICFIGAALGTAHSALDRLVVTGTASAGWSSWLSLLTRRAVMAQLGSQAETESLSWSWAEAESRPRLY